MCSPRLLATIVNRSCLFKEVDNLVINEYSLGNLTKKLTWFYAMLASGDFVLTSVDSSFNSR